MPRYTPARLFYVLKQAFPREGPTMTAFDPDPVLELTTQEAWAKLASVTLGRLATSVGGSRRSFQSTS